MLGQGKSTIDLCATINFTSRTVKSASRHGITRTVARSAPLLFGHRCHVAALRSSMTCHRANHVTTNSGTFPRKTRRERQERKNRGALHCRPPRLHARAGGCSEAEDCAGGKVFRESLASFQGCQTAALNLHKKTLHGGLCELQKGLGSFQGCQTAALNRHKKTLHGSLEPP